MNKETKIKTKTKEWTESHWTFIETVCKTYPIQPNKIIRKKYYEFFKNIPDMMPTCQTHEMYIKYSEMYPISSYLDTRDHLLKWYSLIYEKIDENIGKEVVHQYVHKTFFTKDNLKIIIIVVFLLILYYLLL